MKLLLDTHIWLWSLQGSDRLGEVVQRELIAPQNERWLSPVSTWEALTLHSTGRVVLLPNLPDWVANATKSFRQAPVTHQIALAAREFAFSHPDLADRLLLGTAKVLGLTLVSADRRLFGLSGIATLANL